MSTLSADNKLTLKVPEEFRKALPDAEAWEKHLSLPLEQIADAETNLQTPSANLGSESDNVVSENQNMGNDEAVTVDTAQKVSSEFTKYETMLVEAGITKVFIVNIKSVFQHAGQNAFKQSDVMEYLHCSKSKAGNVMNAMRQAGVIKKVTGMGLGKYQFL